MLALTIDSTQRKTMRPEVPINDPVAIRAVSGTSRPARSPAHCSVAHIPPKRRAAPRERERQQQHQRPSFRRGAQNGGFRSWPGGIAPACPGGGSQSGISAASSRACRAITRCAPQAARSASVASAGTTARARRRASAQSPRAAAPEKAACRSAWDSGTGAPPVIPRRPPTRADSRCPAPRPMTGWDTRPSSPVIHRRPYGERSGKLRPTAPLGRPRRPRIGAGNSSPSPPAKE